MPFAASCCDGSGRSQSSGTRASSYARPSRVVAIVNRTIAVCLEHRNTVAAQPAPPNSLHAYCGQRALATRTGRPVAFSAVIERAGRLKKKERKQTTQGRDGRTVHRHHTGISRRGQCGASRHLPLGACLFLSLFAVCRRFSLPPLCRPAVFLPSSFSLLSLLPLSRRSPLPRSAAPPPPVGPLLSRLLLPLGAVPLSSLRIVAPQVYPAHLSLERSPASGKVMVI